VFQDGSTKDRGQGPDVFASQGDFTTAAIARDGHRLLSSALRKLREVHYDRNP
jgi:hypothetical protein